MIRLVAAVLLTLVSSSTFASEGCPLWLNEKMFNKYTVTWDVPEAISLEKKAGVFNYSSQNKWNDYWSSSITISIDGDYDGEIPAGTRFSLGMDAMFPEYDGFFRPSAHFFLKEMVTQKPSEDSIYTSPKSVGVRVIFLKNVRVKKFERLSGFNLTCVRKK